MTGLWYKKISQRSGIMVTGAIQPKAQKRNKLYHGTTIDKEEEEIL